MAQLRDLHDLPRTVRAIVVEDWMLMSRLLWGLVLGQLLAWPSFAQAVREGYKLAPGDVLSFSIMGVPELSQQRLVIGQDGQVVLPIVGATNAEGETITSLRSAVVADLAGRTIAFRTAGERQRTVLPEEVLLLVAEYRPIYVRGDVPKAGEQAFRPGMTARQALAVAGGSETSPLLPVNLAVQLPDVESEYENLKTQIAAEEAHLARLTAEKTNDQDIRYAGLPPAANGFKSMETDQFRARKQNLEAERAYLDRATGEAAARKDALDRQRDQDQQAARADFDELKRMTSIYGQGTVPSLRVIDARRALFLSASRVAQTEGTLAEAARSAQQLERERTRLGEQRQLEVLAELQRTEINIAGLRAKFEATIQKQVAIRRALGALGSISKANPQLVIFREVGGVRRIAATEDTKLAPGDVLEISVPPAALTAASE